MRFRAAIAPIALALSACAATPQATTPTASPSAKDSASPTASPGSAAEVPEILRFEAARLGGGKIDGSIFVGKKLAVWLWAPWCGPCRRLAPEVVKAAKAYPNISFLGVPGQDSTEAHQAFVDEFGLGDIPQAIDERRALWGHFGSATQEAWLFIDDNGEVNDRTRYGEMSPELLSEYLKELDEL